MSWLGRFLRQGTKVDNPSELQLRNPLQWFPKVRRYVKLNHFSHDNLLFEVELIGFEPARVEKTCSCETVEVCESGSAFLGLVRTEAILQLSAVPAKPQIGRRILSLQRSKELIGAASNVQKGGVN